MRFLLISLLYISNVSSSCMNTVADYRANLTKRAVWTKFVRWSDQKNIPSQNYLNNSVEVMSLFCVSLNNVHTSNQFINLLKKAHEKMIIGKSHYLGQTNDSVFNFEDIGKFRKKNIKVWLNRKEYKVAKEYFSKSKESFTLSKNKIFYTTIDYSMINKEIEEAFKYFKLKNYTLMYYKLVRSHAFSRVNNSIFMALLNTLYAESGKELISHKNLDILAFILDQDSFEVLFEI